MKKTALVLITALALAGCNGAAAGETPTPTPSSPTTATPSASTPASTSTTPSPTASPTPSVDPALLKEAKAVLAKNVEVEGTYFRLGGLPPGMVPDEFKENMTGNALHKSVSLMNKIFESETKYQSGEMKVSNVKVSEVKDPKALIVLQSCRDGRNIKSVRKGKTVPGGLVTHTAHFQRGTDGKLRLSNYSEKGVKSCA